MCCDKEEGGLVFVMERASAAAHLLAAGMLMRDGAALTIAKSAAEEQGV